MHGGQQLVVAQGLEVGHVVRGGVAEVQCQQERGAGGPHLVIILLFMFISDNVQYTMYGPRRGRAADTGTGL